MKRTLLITCFFLFSTIAVNGFASEVEKVDSDKIVSDIQKHLDLTNEKLESLKPLLKEKSDGVQQKLQETLDKGFVELDQLSEQFKGMSEELEAKAKDMLNSEEMAKLKEYLGKVDKDAISKAKEDLINDVTELLELSEEQLEKMGPILDDTFTQISELAHQFMTSGSKNLDDFKSQFETIKKDLDQKLQDLLDEQQKKKLEEHNMELREELKQAIFTA